MPHDFGWPEHAGSPPEPGTADAKVENFFASRVEPHFGQAVPSHLAERTRISESRSHWSQ
jgi:hypothetical protein